MKVGVPSEIKPNEHRVGLTPTAVREYVTHGHEVLIQAGAGGGAGYAEGVSMGSQAVTQVVCVLAVCAWSGIATLVLVFVVRRTVGLRASDDAVDEGLDMSAHGERAYNP